MIEMFSRGYNTSARTNQSRGGSYTTPPGRSVFRQLLVDDQNVAANHRVY